MKTFQSLLTSNPFKEMTSENFVYFLPYVNVCVYVYTHTGNLMCVF